jgi:hypothetical protein
MAQLIEAAGEEAKEELVLTARTLEEVFGQS